MVGALDLASRHTKLATTRGLQSIPALAPSSNLRMCALAQTFSFEASCMPRRPLDLSYLRNLETVRFILMQVNEDLSEFDLVP